MQCVDEASNRWVVMAEKLELKQGNLLLSLSL